MRGVPFGANPNQATTGLFLAAWPSTVCGHTAMVASRPMTSRRLIALVPKLKTRHSTTPNDSTELDFPCLLWVKSGHVQRTSSCPLYPQKRTCAVQNRDVH